MKNLCVAFFLLLNATLLMAQNEHTGTVQRIKCKTDTAQEYALYIPAKYASQKAIPLLIFLDPAARGDLPVNLYHGLADEFGVIMAGSFNSRNFSGNSSLEAFVAVYNDIVNRYTIDPNRVWLSGFSGGARAASSIAMSYPEIKGVIGCGAGFAGNEEATPSNMKAYAALVGNRDMNFGELMDNSHYLSDKRVSNILLVFNGEHTWPPVTHFGVAMEWLMDNTGTGLATVSERGSQLFQSVMTKIDSGFLYPAWFDAQQLNKVKIYRDKSAQLLAEIEKNKNFQADKSRFEKASAEELVVINDFSIAFSNMIFQNIPVERTVWLAKVTMIKAMRRDGDLYRQMAGLRCFDHCTRSCQEQYYQLINTKDYEKALAAADVLTNFLPGDALPYFMMAGAEAGAGKKKQAEKLLKQSVKNGMKLSKRVEEDILLLKVFTVEEIKEIFDK